MNKKYFRIILETLKVQCDVFLYNSFLNDIHENRTKCVDFDQWKEEVRNKDTSQVETMLSSSEGRETIARAMIEPIKRQLKVADV